MRSTYSLRTPLDYVDRRWERTFQGFETRISTYTRFMQPVRVINFSPGGFLLATSEKLNVGDAVKIELAGIGEATGRIAWSLAGRAGGCFDQPIDAGQLMRALEESVQVVCPAE